MAVLRPSTAPRSYRRQKVASHVGAAGFQGKWGDSGGWRTECWVDYRRGALRDLLLFPPRF